MTSMVSTPAAPRSRRQYFIATCAPDELLGQIIQTLCPRYNIDAPHLLALRNVLSRAIVAPKKPPRLMRTRPDKRIGEVGSIYDTPSRCPHGVNGPPVAANKSFYFHHKDPDFEQLLPQVDRSRYEWSDEPASKENEASVETIVLEAPMAAPKRTAWPRSSEFTDYKKSIPLAHTQSSETTRPAAKSEYEDSTSLVHEPSSTATTGQQQPTANSQTSQSASIPTITVTSADTKNTNAAHDDKSKATPSLLLNAAGIHIDLPDTQDTQYTTLSSSVPTHYITCPPDTQDTLASTQQSEVFSPPVDSLHYTPPTQEDSQDVAASQYNTGKTANSTITEKTKKKAPRSLLGRSFVSPEQPTSPAPSLGKRSRKTSGEADGAPPKKRSKSPK